MAHASAKEVMGKMKNTSGMIFHGVIKNDLLHDSGIIIIKDRAKNSEKYLPT
ncbi:hypothetical protein GPU89_30555 [Burkholderia cepacia]|nr:hypothetical protein [Burkholderia cepacia]